MGYIIIDEKQLEHKLRMWNNSDYYNKAMNDVVQSKVDCSNLLKALQQEENKIDEDIKELEEKKSNIESLMRYAK